MRPVVEALEVSFRIGGTAPVRDASLALGGSQLTVIVGPNGAGKTTLLKILAGELRPTQGAVVIDGIPATEIDRLHLARKRAFLADGGAADIPFPVRDVVALGRSPHRHEPGGSREHDDRVIQTAMAACGVEYLAERRFVTLSSGERALVSLARILAQDCPILLLDEPTASLDIRHAERAMGILADEARRGRTVAVVIHDLNAAARHADRCVLMSRGSIVAHGTPIEVLTSHNLTEVYEHPLTVVEDPTKGGPLVVVG
jgi:iron complex transport system ATP-binding protein